MVEEAFLIKSNQLKILKKALAKKLYKKNIDQLKIAKILDISQPMVSNYLKSKKQIPKKFQKYSEDIINNTKKINFYTCITSSNNDLVGSCFIANENEIIKDETKDIIDNLTNAYLKIKDMQIKNLIPEVKMNIAMAKKDAKNKEDIAAFLDGLIIVDGKITGYNGIRFGKSKHLSSLLLYLKEKLNIHSIMNIAYIQKPEKTGFNYSYLTNDYKIKKSNTDFDLLLHRGDFGIEPCSYIIGKNSIDVVNKLIRLKEEVNI